MKKLISFAALFIAMGMVFSVNAYAQKGTGGIIGDKNRVSPIVDVLRSQNRFSILIEAIEKAQIGNILDSQPGGVSLFAPTNAAFAKLPASTVQNILADKEQLIALLSYHVTPVRMRTAEDYVALGTVSTLLQGTTLQFTGNMSNNFYVNSTEFSASWTIPFKNGMIWVIDEVLSPEIM
ncbi:MAG: fasciclin domain-containing protein [Pseudobdellovibrionaceae bacterium]